MEIGSIIGILFGSFFTVFSIIQAAGNDLDKAATFINGPAIMITIGGTFASTFFGITFKKLMASFAAIRIVFKPPEIDPAEAIDKIVSLAYTARKEGILALEDAVMDMDDEFLQKGIMMIVDGNDQELVKAIMETELAHIDERHGELAATFDFIAAQAPAWGMVGTLIGLILMLLDMNDPSNVGPNMAIALVTTFYGSIIANFLALPIANKMKMISKEELLLKSVMVEGMLSVQNGENPRIIEERLKCFLAPSIRSEVGNYDND